MAAAVTDSLPILPLPRRLNKFAEGGLSIIYHHPSDPDLLIKVFTDSNKLPQPKVGSDADHVIALGSFGQGITHAKTLRLDGSFSWPVEVFGRGPRHVDAVAIRRAPEDFYVDVTVRSFADGERTKRTLLDFSYLVTDYLARPVVIRVDPRYAHPRLADRIEICRELILTMKVVWSLGYRFCDFKPHNMAWTLEGRPRVFIMDSDSIQVPGIRGLHSPGEWWPNPNLIDSMESDRSLCARMVWRAMCIDMGSRPEDHVNVRPPKGSPVASLDRSLIKALADAHTFGTEEAIEAVLAELEVYRESGHVEAAFDWAVDSGYAELVLENEPPTTSAAQATVVARARIQREREDELLRMPSLLRTVMLETTVPETGFIWGVSGDAMTGEEAPADEILRHLALEGRHREVAMTALEYPIDPDLSRVAERSIQVALAEVGVPPLGVRSGGGREQIVEWAWPAGGVVFGARVVVEDSRGRVRFEQVLDKNSANPRIRIPRVSGPTEQGVVRVSFAASSKNGKVVTCPVQATAAVTVSQARPSAPIPTPRKPHIQAEPPQPQGPDDVDHETVPPPIPPGIPSISPRPTVKIRPPTGIAQRPSVSNRPPSTRVGWWARLRRRLGFLGRR